MVYKAAVQILKQADDLKERILRKCDLLNDSQTWTDQQKLQRIYHQALVMDLEYALDKKIEQDLWNIGFKNHITLLQEMARDKKNLQRTEYQTLLTWCLEAAAGFYLTLFQELCDMFDIDLPFRRRGNIYGQINLQSNLPQQSPTSSSSSSCLYICQYCLVHLGDIARYRNQRKESENFYKQAIQVSPISGHPYNQLALLETSQGNKLSTVFYYIRAIAVKNPFPAATTNLLNILNTTIDKDNPLEQRIQTKITVNEFIQIFLCTHAFIHTTTELKQTEICLKTLNTTMTALVATHSFTNDKLLKMTIINLYALKYVITSNSITELTDDELNVRQHILDLLAGSLSAFLVPVHTLKNDETLFDYYALPAIKILTDWIQAEPKILEEVVFTNRLQIWPSLCKLLNNVAPFLSNFNDQYIDCPLSEDRDLQGFTPLAKSLKMYDFKKFIKDVKTEKLVRMKRIVDFGRFLTEFNVNNAKLIIMKKEGDGFSFEPGFTQPDPTNDLLEEMKSFNITTTTTTNLERRGGILKPQGSLEKSREERDLLSIKEPIIDNKKETIKQKRTKQNVAIQSIFKKLEENKQVKFNVVDDDDDNNDKEQIRIQSFNQNLSGFPTTPPNQPDYLTTLRNISKPLNQQQNFNDKPPPPSMLPYPNSNLQQSSVFSNSYQHVPFSMNYGEEPSSSTTSTQQWWPNSNQQSSYHYPQYSYLQSDSNQSNSNNDLFNPSWNQFRQSNFGNFDGVSMRQAMLKEATNQSENFPQNPPSYSLFNTNNNWTTNLVGQLRKSQDNKMNNLPQHSLFTGQGPQSLAQLLEQQQSQKK